MRPLAVVFVLFLSLSAAHAELPLEVQIARAATALRPDLVACRRDLHQHPELSNREQRTSRVVADKLRGLGLEVKTGVGRHGVVALIKGGKPGAVVAARADMDALPIDETLDVPYRSQNKGVKHACGHDAHTAILLGVAEILTRLRPQLQGTVKLIFQPAEEGAPAGEKGGARLMIEEGVLDNPKPRAIFGLHVMPDVEVGRIGYSSGAAMASSDRMVITIHGKASHGAWPNLGIDAVTVASEVVLALQTIRSRRIDQTEPLVLSLGTIHGGRRYNIIADEVKLEGTIRTLDESTRKQVKTLIDEILRGVTSAHGASYEITWDDSALVTYNDPALVSESVAALERVVGTGGRVQSLKPRMVAEDFSFYQQRVPGFFWFLGAGNAARKITAPNHTPEFDIDEDALVVGTRALATQIVDHLERHARP